MCYNYSLNTSIKSLEQRFNAKAKQEISLPIYRANAFHFGKMPVITNQNPQDIQLLKWGLIPNFTRSDRDANEIKKMTLNAKAETIFEKPAYRKSIENKRCLIPATGYFEWQHLGKEKIPYYIYIPKITIFSFAGIWDSYISETGETQETFTIITTEADEFNSKIHNSKLRMPLIIDQKEEELWLSNRLKKEEIKSLLNSTNIDFEAYRISKEIGDKKKDTNVPHILNKMDDGSLNYTLFG